MKIDCNVYLGQDFGWLLTAILLACCINIPSWGVAQNLDVSFSEKMVLGNDADASKAYLFSNVQELDTDSQGRIYIADVNNQIRVFSPQGVHITTFGGRGRGPGEFNKISVMVVAADGEVIINDRDQFRITRFFNLGDSLKTYSLNNWKVRQGRQMLQENIVPLGNERYAITSKIRDAYYKRSHKELDNRVVHVVPEDFSEFELSMFDVYREGMFDPSEPLERDMATGSRYHLDKLPDEKLVLSHEVYNGAIYIMEIDDSNKNITEVNGEFAGRQRYTILDGESKELFNRGYTNLVMSSSPLGSFNYQMNLGSEGLFTNDDWIVNVVSVADGMEISFHMEFFDAGDGSYLGYTNIDDDFNTYQQDRPRQSFHPKHLDNQNRLYYVDYTGGVPVIRVTKITVE